jgi:integrase
MSIQIFCPECKTSSGLDADFCSKCEKPFGRSRQYRVQVSVKGNRKTRVVDNLTIAREVEAALKADLIREEFDVTHHKVKQVATLDDVWSKFLPWAKSNKRKSWVTDDFFYRKHLQPRFGKKALDKITAFAIEKMKSEMKQATTPQGRKGYADATIRHQLVLLGHLFSKAAEWKMFDGNNPVKSVKKPKLDNKITEFMVDAEVQRLLDTLDSWPCKQSADFVRIGMFTAVRKSEIRKLTWDCVDFERKTLAIRDPKGGVSMIIPLSDEAVEVFRGIEHTSEYVIPGPDGGLKKTFRDPWYKIRRAAGLPKDFRYHGLRHHLASSLVSDGTDLYTVGKLLCHKDVRTTERYAHLSDHALRAAAARGGKLLTPKKQDNNVVRLVQ